MGCNNFLTERIDKLIEASMRGENSGFSEETLKEWNELQSPEARQEMFRELDNLSEEAREASEKPDIPPENLKDWAEYLDIMNRDLENIREKAIERLEVMPGIDNFRESGTVDDNDIKYHLAATHPAERLAKIEAILYTGDKHIRSEGIVQEYTDANLIGSDLKPIVYVDYQYLNEELEKLEKESGDSGDPWWKELSQEDRHYYVTDHGIGHTIWQELPPEFKERFIEHHNTTKERGAMFVTRYARENPVEDFCDCLMVYKNQPDRLFNSDIEKFRDFNELAKGGMI